MSKQTSDRVASLASHIMTKGNPLDSDEFVDAMVGVVRAAESTQVAREVVREALFEFMQTAKSLAASCVSQGDGPE